MEQLSIEVVIGPMEGLFYPLSGNNISLGRKVGNDIKPFIDRTISNIHAELIVEGPHWCLRDLRSEDKIKDYGIICLCGKPLQSQISYPLRNKDIFLIGSTIFEVFKSNDPSKYEINLECYEDPRKIYSMSTKLKCIWDSILSSKTGFCDTNYLLETIAFQEKNDDCYCISQIRSPFSWTRIANWLNYYEQDYNDLEIFDISYDSPLISPRVWKILNIASEFSKEDITINDVINAICYEDRSIASRYLKQDNQFLNIYNNKTEEKDTRPKAIKISSLTKLNENTQTKKNINLKPNKKKENIDKQLNNEFWQNQIKSIDKIILGFFDDIFSNQKIFYKKDKLKDLIKEGDKEKISNYLEQYLENNLISLITGYMNSIEQIQNNMRDKIEITLDEVIENAPPGFFSGNKGKELEEMREKVLDTIDIFIQEGLAYDVVLDSIKELLA